MKTGLHIDFARVKPSEGLHRIISLLRKTGVTGILSQRFYVQVFVNKVFFNCVVLSVFKDFTSL